MLTRAATGKARHLQDIRTRVMSSNAQEMHRISG
jgi:hypothetical protein